jgi:hypothetical protein
MSNTIGLLLSFARYRLLCWDVLIQKDASDPESLLEHKVQSQVAIATANCDYYLGPSIRLGRLAEFGNQFINFHIWDARLKCIVFFDNQSFLFPPNDNQRTMVDAQTAQRHIVGLFNKVTRTYHDHKLPSPRSLSWLQVQLFPTLI